MGQKHRQQSRTLIAQQAARLMHENGIRDFGAAKRKAAQQLGIVDQASMPGNSEIEAALHAHLRLFTGSERQALVRHLREAAIEAMTFLADYRPRLVGAVLDGSADAHSAVCLHLFTDQPDSLGLRLAESGIDYQLDDRRLRMDARHTVLAPVYRCLVRDIGFDLTVLPIDGLRQAPLDRTGDHVMTRATQAQVQALLDADTGAG